MFKNSTQDYESMTLQEKKKIAICLRSLMVQKTFYDTGAFKEIEKNFDVTYLISEGMSIDNPSCQAMILNAPQWRSYALVQFLDRYSYISLNRHRNRSNSFKLKFENYYSLLTPKQKLFVKTISLPVIFEVASFLFKKIFFPTKDFTECLQKLAPDLVFTPSLGTTDDVAMNLIAAANILKIPTLAQMYNWDNVTCKGVYPFLPTYACVWGVQTLEHYHQIHKLPRSKICTLGAPQFEVYEQFDHNQPTELREQIGISEQAILCAYLGGARYRDDIWLLKELDKILVLSNCFMVYRPHPWQDKLMLEGDFFAHEFKRITMDPAISEHYRRCRHDKTYIQKSFVYSYVDFPKFLSDLDFVISSYSTMAIESLKMGKPVLLTAFPDPKFKYSFDKLRLYEHHNCWEKFSNVVECRNAIDLQTDFKCVLKFIRDPVVERNLKEQVKFVAYSDQHSYSTRLLNCINSIFKS